MSSDVLRFPPLFFFSLSLSLSSCPSFDIAKSWNSSRIYRTRWLRRKRLATVTQTNGAAAFTVVQYPLNKDGNTPRRNTFLGQSCLHDRTVCRETTRLDRDSLATGSFPLATYSYSCLAMEADLSARLCSRPQPRRLLCHASLPIFPPLVNGKSSRRARNETPSAQAIKEITVKTDAVKSETAELSRSAAAIREGCAELKKASFAAKDRVAAGQTALKQAEVRARPGRGGSKDLHKREGNRLLKRHSWCLEGESSL